MWATVQQIFHVGAYSLVITRAMFIVHCRRPSDGRHRIVTSSATAWLTLEYTFY